MTVYDEPEDYAENHRIDSAIHLAAALVGVGLHKKIDRAAAEVVWGGRLIKPFAFCRGILASWSGEGNQRADPKKIITASKLSVSRFAPARKSARDSKRPTELTAEEATQLKADIAGIPEQLGKWVAVDLHLGLGDRGKLDNCAWSHGDRRLAAVDTESAFQNASVADHRIIVDAFYGAAKMKAERGVRLRLSRSNLLFAVLTS